MSVSTTTELKGLQTHLAKTQAELDLADNELNIAREKYNTLNSRVGELQKRIKELTKKPAKITISEHALLRYIERVMGLDMSKIKEEIMENSYFKQTALKNFKATIGGHAYIVKDNVLVTIE